MRLLLDTHAWLWLRTGSPRLGPIARGTIADPSNDVAVSVAYVWEVGIKEAIGKLTLPQPLDQWLGAALAAFDIVPISLDHVRIAPGLPQHHKDPFDRMLIAQAQVGGFTLVTADPLVRLYGGSLLRADA